MKKETVSRVIAGKDTTVGGIWYDRNNADMQIEFHPSTDLNDAMLVIKEMSAQNYWCDMGIYSSFCKVIFTSIDAGKEICFEAKADTYDLSLAICRAALLSLVT